jgi:hypothetical protein
VRFIRSACAARVFHAVLASMPGMITTEETNHGTCLNLKVSERRFVLS